MCATGSIYLSVINVDSTLPIAIGILATCLAGFGVRPLLDHIEKVQTDLLRNATKGDVEAERLLRLIARGPGGNWVGFFERLIFFGSIWVNSPTIVVAWLAFKVASKWKSWELMPPGKRTNDSDHSAIPDDELTATVSRGMGSLRLTTFLVGTGANLVIAFAGVWIGRHAWDALCRAFC